MEKYDNNLSPGGRRVIKKALRDYWPVWVLAAAALVISFARGLLS